MRRSASQILRNLENRVANLEREAIFGLFKNKKNQPPKTMQELSEFITVKFMQGNKPREITRDTLRYSLSDGSLYIKTRDFNSFELISSHAGRKGTKKKKVNSLEGLTQEINNHIGFLGGWSDF